MNTTTTDHDTTTDPTSADQGQAFEVGAQLVGECVTWITKGRGFGFLKVDGYAKELFVPARSLRGADRLTPGDRVAFEVRLGYDCRLMADLVELL